VARAAPTAGARRVRRPNAVPGVTRCRARGRPPVSSRSAPTPSAATPHA